MNATRALHRAAISPSSAMVIEPSEMPSIPPVVCKADITRDDLTGLMIGQYALGKKIGGGGMGCVFAARHTHLDRAVAIKFIAADSAALPEAAVRFEQETLALGQLQHPHIVNAIDAGSVNGLKYLVTEYIDGVDLGQYIEKHGPLPFAEACRLIQQAALGLAHSHRCGFLHRDIKPNNLILDRSGVVKILDFGLVRNAAAGVNQTVSGEMLGTFDFVSPEQAHDASTVDARSDIYSLGCTFIYLLTGRAPFDGARYATVAAKLKGHLFDEPEWLIHPPVEIPRELVAVIAQMVAKSPSQRFASADDVVELLAPWVDSSPDLAIPSNRDSTKNFRPLTSVWAFACIVAVSLAVMVAISGKHPVNPTFASNPITALESATRTTNDALPSETPAEKTEETPANPPEEIVSSAPAVQRPAVPAEKVITSETTTTVNAVPFELNTERPKTNRLPAAFGSAQ